jgi:hypothetical protein
MISLRNLRDWRKRVVLSLLDYTSVRDQRDNIGIQYLKNIEICFSPFFGNTGVWTQSFVLARQVHYHLSHAPTTFALVFLQIVSGVGPQYSYFCLPSTWEYRHAPPCLVKLLCFEEK